MKRSLKQYLYWKSLNLISFSQLSCISDATTHRLTRIKSLWREYMRIGNFKKILSLNMFQCFKLFCVAWCFTLFISSMDNIKLCYVVLLLACKLVCRSIHWPESCMETNQCYSTESQLCFHREQWIEIPEYFFISFALFSSFIPNYRDFYKRFLKILYLDFKHITTK